MVQFYKLNICSENKICQVSAVDPGGIISLLLFVFIISLVCSFGLFGGGGALRVWVFLYSPSWPLNSILLPQQC